MPPFRLISKRLFLASPGPKTALWANVYYTRRSGVEKMSVHYYERRDDLYDNVYLRWSADNGRTWSEPQEVKHHWQTESGVMRTWRDGGGWGIYVDPERDVMVRLYNEAVLPTDYVHEERKHGTVHYAISKDGGRSNAFEGQVIQKGDKYHERHPVPGVWMGHNALQIGGVTAIPIRNQRGQILQPVDIPPLGPDGEMVNPGGGPSYHNTGVLIGTWTADNRLEWELSQMVIADPARTTRGNMETTLALLPDGRVLMVLRGSNANRPELPGYRWHSVSEDDGYTWTPPQPWRYDGGAAFFSPSSSSLLVRHSSGDIYWLANIVAENPRGNLPRYPLVIAQVDPETLLLQRDTVYVIEDRLPGDHADVQLSNFMVHEDRETGEIVLNLTRFLSQGIAAWDGDAYEYRLAVDPSA